MFSDCDWVSTRDFHMYMYSCSAEQVEIFGRDIEWVRVNQYLFRLSRNTHTQSPAKCPSTQNVVEKLIFRNLPMS